ncbi:MAG: glycosyltransferase family 4 protein [Candidatus Promineifilaceae bacterium]|jgi:glycosyltransferase involved in cell wall biosynthesis
MKKLRILEVQETNWLDRNVIQPHHILERLVERGHSVQIIDYDILWPQRQDRSLMEGRKLFPSVNRVIPGVTIPVIRPSTIHLPLLCHLSWTMNSLRELQRLLDTFQPDVVIGYSLTNSYFMALLVQSRGVPFVSMVLEPYHTMVPQQWAKSVAKLMEKKAEQTADRVFVFTPKMSEYIEGMGVRKERITIFRTGVSPKIFSVGVNGQDKRADLGIKEDDWVLFFMGWLYDFSGLKEIVQTVMSDPSILEDKRLLIVGDGDLYEELCRLVEQYGLSQRVILTGRVPFADIPALLATADVCLLPSQENDITRDIVPMKVYEYLAAGRPVVASSLPGLVTEFGEDNGILYGAGSLDVFAKALAMSEQQEFAHALAAKGREFAEKNANWEETADHFEEVLLFLSNGVPPLPLV